MDISDIWNHSIIDSPKFVAPWKASFQALDLSHEVGTWNHQPQQKMVEGIKKKANRRVRFSPTIELYVGHAQECEMLGWSHALEVPHLRAPIIAQIQPDHDGEEMALLAMHHHPQALPQPANFVMEDPQIVQQEQEQVFDIEVEVPQEEEESEEAMSFAPQVQEDWRTVLTFALGRDATPLRLDWNNHELVHHSVARELGVFPGHLFHLHHVEIPPADLYYGHVEVLIAHRDNDIQIGTTQKLVLFDVATLHL